MENLSNYIKTNCCGTTCDKAGLVQRVAELETQLNDAKTEVEDLQSRLRGGYKREEFARLCFVAGYDAAPKGEQFDHGVNKAWLEFKATEDL